VHIFPRKFPYLFFAFYLTGKCTFANTSDVSNDINGTLDFDGATETRRGIDGGKNDTNNDHVQED
jgi:hypothetical protein